MRIGILREAAPLASKAKPSIASRRPPDALSREAIVDAALSLIDRDGLQEFSLREVARALGVYPTAIYWHVKGGRNGLLAAVAARALKGVTPPLGPGDDWKHWLRVLFRRYRDALRRHPNVAPLLGAQLVSNAGVSPILVERMLTALQSAGFRATALVDAYNAVLAALLGYVTLEFAPAPADDPQGWARDFEQELRALPSDLYPTLHENFALLANRAFVLRWQSGTEVALTGGFDMFVDAFVLGLEQKLRLAGSAG